MFITPDHGEGARFIEDLRELKLCLMDAVALELFTIPPYLCALWSLKDGKLGTNQEAYHIIRSVVMEEMLHMILAANILNSIGGTPSICKVPYLPKYPDKMPHSKIGFEVSLLKFSKEAVNTFLKIERPAERGSTAPVRKKSGGTRGGKGKLEFASIGEFYAAVREAINRLDREAKDRKQKNGIFTGKPQLQVTDVYYYGSGGKLVPVHSIDDANLAIDEIVGQGEGIDGSIKDGDDAMFDEEVELAHYFRFNEIFCERSYKRGDKPSDDPSGDVLKVDWDAVYNMIPNPTMDKLKKRQRVHSKAMEFNRTYSEMLRNIQQAVTGTQGVLMRATCLMHTLREQAVDLMNEESGVGEFAAGPTFEYVV
jgi:hypothetical protein